MNDVYFAVTGKFLVGRSIESCHRYDLVATLVTPRGELHWGVDNPEARLKLVRLKADEFGQQEFCEWMINRIVEG